MFGVLLLLLEKHDVKCIFRLGRYLKQIFLGDLFPSTYLTEMYRSKFMLHLLNYINASVKGAVGGIATNISIRFSRVYLHYQSGFEITFRLFVSSLPQPRQVFLPEYFLRKMHTPLRHVHFIINVFIIYSQMRRYK